MNQQRQARLFAIVKSVQSALADRAAFLLFGAALQGLPHAWAGVNKWTHSTLIAAMHGHVAHGGDRAMIVWAMINDSLPVRLSQRGRVAAA